MTAAAELDRARSTDRAKVDGAPKLTRRRLSIKHGAGSVPQSPSLSSTPSRLAKDKADMGGNGKSPGATQGSEVTFPKSKEKRIWPEVMSKAEPNAMLDFPVMLTLMFTW